MTNDKDHPSILVVDDEPSICEVVSLYLTRAGYHVRLAHDGRTALRALTESLPDLVILDIMLPEIDGLEIIRRLRTEGPTPVILLTARQTEADRILGLELGADDYVVKPFSPPELVSRVRAVLRRTHPPLPTATPTGAPTSPLTVPGLRLDPTTRTVTPLAPPGSSPGALPGAPPVTLAAKEFDLLLFLATHPGQVFNRDQLLEQVWGGAQFIDASTVTVHVRRLREKLESDPAAPRFIQTVWGVGYRFNPGDQP